MTFGSEKGNFRRERIFPLSSLRSCVYVDRCAFVREGEEHSPS